MRVWVGALLGVFLWVVALVMLAGMLPTDWHSTPTGQDDSQELAEFLTDRRARRDDGDALKIGAVARGPKRVGGARLDKAEKGDHIIVFEHPGCGGERKRIDVHHDESLCESCWSSCGTLFDNSERPAHLNLKSIRVNTEYEVELYSHCLGSFTYDDPGVDLARARHPKGTCLEMPGGFAHVKFFGVPVAEEGRPNYDNVPSYNVAFSVESSFYFAYQSVVNRYAFEQTHQSPRAKITRLLTCSEKDDLMDLVPTFQAPRDQFSRKYSPFNKPDVVTKWFESDEAPTEDVIVLIDPDNWLTKDLSPIISQVKEGQAQAAKAFYYGNSQLTALWKEYCKENCDAIPDGVAVPYFVHREDLRRIAPLWREYTLAIRKDWEGSKRTYLDKKYKSLQISWCVEMFAYNFAAAQLGIKHHAQGFLQLRDVDSRRSDHQNRKIYMIHMGRAWFPKSYEPGLKWLHTEGKMFNRFGNQVWCKCNYTAGTIIPWPLPEGLDFVSRVTLTNLHNGMEKYPIPKKSKYYGDPATSHGYHRSFE